MRTTIEYVHATMKGARKKIKNAPIIRNLTELRPVMNCPTPWTGKFDMLSKFETLRSDLIEVSQHEDADLKIEETIHFAAKVNTFRRCHPRLMQ